MACLPESWLSSMPCAIHRRRLLSPQTLTQISARYVWVIHKRSTIGMEDVTLPHPQTWNLGPIATARRMSESGCSEICPLASYMFRGCTGKMHISQVRIGFARVFRCQLPTGTFHHCSGDWRIKVDLNGCQHRGPIQFVIACISRCYECRWSPSLCQIHSRNSVGSG